MGFTSGLIVGGAIGYVLGAQAGRERYDQLLAMYEDFKARPEVQDLTAKGKSLMDTAQETARKMQSSSG